MNYGDAMPALDRAIDAASGGFAPGDHFGILELAKVVTLPNDFAARLREYVLVKTRGRYRPRGRNAQARWRRR